MEDTCEREQRNDCGDLVKYDEGGNMNDRSICKGNGVTLDKLRKASLDSCKAFSDRSSGISRWGRLFRRIKKSLASVSGRPQKK